MKREQTVPGRNQIEAGADGARTGKRMKGIDYGTEDN